MYALTVYAIVQHISTAALFDAAHVSHISTRRAVTVERWCMCARLCKHIV